MSSELSIVDLAARHKEIVEQQMALAHELVSISRALNASRPINKLPVELLVKIFYCLQMHNGIYNESWYSVAAVCKLWHDVAQGCMSLRRRITVGPRFGFRLVNLFLARPGVLEAGFKGYLPMIHESNAEHVESVRDRVMCVKYASDKRVEGCYHERALRHIEKFAMLTEVLVVLGKGYKLFNEHEDDDGHIEDRVSDSDDPDELHQKQGVPGYQGHFAATLELAVDSAMFPNLQYLTLFTAALDTSSVSLPALRKLHLHDCTRMSMSLPTFLTFISQCQSLEILVMTLFRPKDDHLPTCLPEAAPLEITPLLPVALPGSLRMVAIEDIAPWTARILEGMSLPERTNLLVNMTGTLDHQNDWKREWAGYLQLHSALPPRRSHIEVLRFADTIRIHVDKDRHTSYRIVARSSWDKRKGTLALLWGHKWGSSKYCESNFLSDLTNIFCEATIVCLTIVIRGRISLSLDKVKWTIALKALPALKSLAVTIDIAVEQERWSNTDTFLVLEFRFLDAKNEEDAISTIKECLSNRAARGRSLTRLVISLLCGSQPLTDWPATRDSMLERYKEIFQPYVEVVSCDGASYFCETDISEIPEVYDHAKYE
ncbi:hypothetical protein C8Q73DRAFT_688591 [Cubamyces lactineus]|nr:hypothetical protein C8Q73DRAFT_688591 [Cubamyces lactineus]